LFNVIDDYDREGLGIEVDFSLPSERVIDHSTGLSNGAASHWSFAAITVQSTSAR